MRRKTNLFYKTDIDSRFLMFSNYPESMTGNYLATNVKLFPSKFLCLFIPSIENDEGKRLELINILASRYENKLSFLRDKCKEENANQETRIKPLGWLLDAIYDFDNEVDVSFIGQVAEQDYNGIYSDTICVIDSSTTRRGQLEVSEQDITDYEEYDSSRTFLYGWYDTVGEEDPQEIYSGPSEYSTVRPVLDYSNLYYYVPKITKVSVIDEEEKSPIKFNVLIPLYDVININHYENKDVIENFEDIDTTADSAAVVNVPYGIWFSKDTVLLNRDETEYGPSWSLCLSSQFKPFPYSYSKVSEVDNDAIGDSFNTFASILTRQNQIMDKVLDFSYVLSGLATQISLIESQISNIATIYNIDNIKNDLASVKSDVSYLMSKI